MSTPSTACDHSESLYGRCARCGLTWEQQAEAQAAQRVVDREDLRKQIARAIREHVYVLDGHSEVSGHCKCGENHGYSQDLNQADAVLALLNGRQS